MVEELEKKAADIREILIQTVSQRGGHLGPNLGVVELSIALHEVFDFREDKLLFDVGHQAYVHKILTDRREAFSTLRKRGGLGPFQDPQESPWDPFISGHAGTALAAGVGIAKAHPDKKVVVVVGDAAIANGHSMEALNYIGGEGLKNLLVILNDNEMSIGENVGFISTAIGKLMLSSPYMSLRKDIRALVDKMQAKRVKNTLERMEISLKNFVFPNNVAENFGYFFLGSVDGHDFTALLKVLEKAKQMEGPLFLHVRTVKGKGYALAEQDMEKFHGIAPFDPNTGKVASKGESYSSIFAKKILEFAKEDEDIYALSSGMLGGTGLKEMNQAFPDRAIDTGISEGFATSFAAGLAISGKKPYLCIYSTFLQRAFSQVIHDIVLQDLPVRLIVDRAGLVGEDGKTHHGLHDLDFLLSLPNMTVLSPCTGKELKAALDYSKGEIKAPLAIRMPRATAYSYEGEQDWQLGKWQEAQKGDRRLFLAMGSMLEELLDSGVKGRIMAVSSLRPLDEDFLLKEMEGYEDIFVCEEGYREASFYRYLLVALQERGLQYRLHSISLDSCSIPHGNRKGLLEEYGLRGTKLLERIEEKVHGGKK